MGEAAGDAHSDFPPGNRHPVVSCDPDSADTAAVDESEKFAAGHFHPVSRCAAVRIGVAAVHIADHPAAGYHDDVLFQVAVFRLTAAKFSDGAVGRDPAGEDDPARWSAEIHVLGIYDPKGGEEYRNRLVVSLLTDEGRTIEKEIDITDALSQALTGNGGDAPAMDMTIELNIELQSTELGVVGEVDSWQYVGNSMHAVN